MQEPIEGSEFWRHIETLKAGKSAPPGAETYRKRVRALLATLDGKGVARFIRGHRIARVRMRTRAHWMAASLAMGHLCEDDDFEHFRAWAIAHGRDAFERALADPDVLAAWDMPTDRAGAVRPLLPSLVATSWKVYEDLQDAGLDKRIDRELDSEHLGDDAETHIGWAYWAVPTTAELKRQLPGLWARYGKDYSASGKASKLVVKDFSSFVREADVIGLGRVKIGDVLARRGSDETFTVLGINDGSVVFGSGIYVGGEEHRYTARIRDDDGSVHCNQGLSGRYQRWPHEPDTGIVEDDDAPPVVDEARMAEYEARDDAIQARLKAALRDAKEVRVVFSAYEEDEDGLPVDNLDAVAHRGAIRFIETDPGDGQRFESEVVENPTWLALARIANEMLIALGDRDHVYLEGFEVVRKPRKQAAIGEFLMGS